MQQNLFMSSCSISENQSHPAWDKNEMPSMPGSFQGTGLLLFLILLLCCVGLIQGKAKVLSYLDCIRSGRTFECRNHGFQDVPYDYAKYNRLYKHEL